MYIPLSPARTRTEATFTAPDPWNQNQRTAFTVEAYMMVVRGTTPKPGTKPLSGYLYGIRSELDGRERMLPESLSELWRTNKIPPEALPRLLQQMLPTLKKWDYRMILHNKVLQVTQIVFVVLMTLVCLMPLAVAIGTNEIPIRVALPMTLGFGSFVALFYYFLFYRKKARRMKQMKWALDHK